MNFNDLLLAVRTDGEKRIVTCSDDLTYKDLIDSTVYYHYDLGTINPLNLPEVIKKYNIPDICYINVIDFDFNAMEYSIFSLNVTLSSDMIKNQPFITQLKSDTSKGIYRYQYIAFEKVDILNAEIEC